MKRTLRHLVELSGVTLSIACAQANATVDWVNTIEPLGVAPSAMLLFAYQTENGSDGRVSIIDLKNGLGTDFCDGSVWTLGVGHFLRPAPRGSQEEKAQKFTDKAEAKVWVEKEWGLKLVEPVEVAAHPNLKVRCADDQGTPPCKILWNDKVTTKNVRSRPDSIYSIPGMETQFALLLTSECSGCEEDRDTTTDMSLHVVPSSPTSNASSCLSPRERLVRTGKAATADAEAKRANQLGLNLYRAGKKSEAASQFMKAIGMNPTLTPALVNYASVLQATLPQATPSHAASFDAQRLEPWLIVLYALHLDSKYTREKLKTDPDFKSFQTEIRIPFRERTFAPGLLRWQLHQLNQRLCGSEKQWYAPGRDFEGVLSPLSWRCFESATYAPPAWELVKWPDSSLDHETREKLGLRERRLTAKTTGFRLSLPRRVFVSSAMLSRREFLIPFHLDGEMAPTALRKLFAGFKKVRSRAKGGKASGFHPLDVQLKISSPNGEKWDVRIALERISDTSGKSEELSFDPDSYILSHPITGEESVGLRAPVGDLLSLFSDRAFVAGDYTLEVHFLGVKETAKFSIDVR